MATCRSHQMDAEHIFWASAQVVLPSLCWEWRRAKRSLGYGAVQWSGSLRLAHRVAYELTFGPIPAGLVIDHLCRNPSCINPMHLEPVSQRENLLRGTGVSAQNAQKTECKRGHPLVGENLIVTNVGNRGCRACKRLRDAKRRAAR